MSKSSSRSQPKESNYQNNIDLVKTVTSSEKSKKKFASPPIKSYKRPKKDAEFEKIKDDGASFKRSTPKKNNEEEIVHLFGEGTKKAIFYLGDKICTSNKSN